tara:strand:- start:1635 stop:2441 length:807 start_codon:yes stop_codon:yes gene_type:complete
MNVITYVTCWYQFKAKFDNYTYENWIDNMLSNVNNYKLVVFTDEDGYKQLKKYEQPNVKIIIKPYTKFYGYQFQEQWIKNHEKNYLLKEKVDWRVNMLWSEKIHFVKQVIDKKYFDTDFYGWCDIGYFRNRKNDSKKEDLLQWPNQEKILRLDPRKVHYALINNNQTYISYLHSQIIRKNRKGLPIHEIPPNQCSVAGGFFTLHKDKIEWWHETYYKRLKLYFDNDYLVKDDQILIIDNIFSHSTNFQLYSENNQNYDNWFMFQRIFS